MPYSPQTWIDNNSSYPLSAARMNNIETGIQSAASVADQGHRILTTAQRDALGAVTVGTMIWNTTTQRYETYVNGAWVGMATGLVFTNEAARDAAITSPQEGMAAYLTTPTIPAATGVVTAVPTGVQTIYNGTNWVCVTEIGASSTTSANTNSSSYVTTLSGDGTAVSVTLVTGTTAKIEYGFWGSGSGAGILSQDFTVSGATTRSANDTTRVIHQQTAGSGAMAQSPFRSFVITGLTAGTNTFTLSYKTDGSTQTWNHRVLTVKGIA